jgi:hypothetical protein
MLAPKLEHVTDPQIERTGHVRHPPPPPWPR